MEFSQSNNIWDYGEVLDKLYPDFGNPFCHTILCWCGVMEKTENKEECYWKLWLIKDSQQKTIGICGLYSLVPNNVETLWLGWFGIYPEYRNQNKGVLAIKWLKKTAKKLGAKVLMSYVDKNGKPLSFYERNEFKVIGNVADYIKENNLDISNFESEEDYVIKCKL